MRPNGDRRIQSVLALMLWLINSYPDVASVKPRTAQIIPLLPEITHLIAALTKKKRLIKQACMTCFRRPR